MPQDRLLTALAAAAVVLVCAGCSKPAPETSPAANAVTGSAAGAPPAAPSAPAAAPSPAAAPAETSKTSRPAASKQRLTIPAGKLDDAKFISISAKYATAALRLGDKGSSDADALRLALSAILKEANVTVDEYSQYASAVSTDPQRRQKVADAILRLTEKQSGAKLRGK